MPNVTVEQVSRIEGIPNVKFETSEAAQIYYMCMRGSSYKNPVMAEKEFRTALAKSIDKEGYVQ